MRFDTLDPDVRRRFAALKALLGDDEAVAAKSMSEEEMVQIIANGLNITVEDALDLLRALLGIEEEREEAFAVATKSHERPGRDSRGRRIDKLYGSAPRASEEPPGPRRDSRGKRIHKPHDPRRFDSQRRNTDAGR